jgi:hypothetical protein
MPTNVDDKIRSLAPRSGKVEARAAQLIAEEMTLPNFCAARKLTQWMAGTPDIAQDSFAPQNSDLLLSPSERPSRRWEEA